MAIETVANLLIEFVVFLVAYSLFILHVQLV